MEHRHTKGADEVDDEASDEADEVKEWMVPASEFVNMSVVSSSGSGILPRACRIRLSKQQPK